MDKKHEDAGGVAQIDKTSVFQEGRQRRLLQRERYIHIVAGDARAFVAQDQLTMPSSTSIQPEPHLAQEM